jgi:hypothetical protein
MQKLKLFILAAIIALLTSAALQSCTKIKNGTYKNDQINAGMRSDFHKLNDQLFAALKANNANDVQNMMSEELLNGEGKAGGRLVELASLRIKSDGYDLLDEYYIKGAKPRGNLDKTTKITYPAYTLKFDGEVDEEYFAFLIPKAGDNKYLITAIYYKTNYGWRLNHLETEAYTIDGNNAPALYKKAQDQNKKGYLVNAVNTMMLANKCSIPSTYIVYSDLDSIRPYLIKLINQANREYKFPFAIDGISTKPVIIRIATDELHNQTVPQIYYLTHINIADTIAVKKENQSIQQVIGKVIPGIDKDNKYILFSACNEMPQVNRSPAYFDMVYKIN